jgi:aryl-alcohol dehydrogenase-like predicted oxidoreductase
MHGSRRLGVSDLEVGPISYGCWRFAGTSVASAHAKIERALDHGMNLIDTADIYGRGGPGFGAAEALLGDVLRAAPALRDRMIIATKGGISPEVPYDSSRAYLIEACEASRRRLGVDVIDLYQIHRPDLLAHPAEVAASLGELVDRGWVRHVGVSNYSASQLDAVLAHCEGPIITSQPEFSLWHLAPLDDGVLDRCLQHRITPLAWSPLGGGRIGHDDPLTALLDELAETHEVTRTAIALSFVLGHPSRPVAIIGTQQLDRIDEAATSSRVVLEKSELYRLIAAAGRVLP